MLKSPSLLILLSAFVLFIATISHATAAIPPAPAPLSPAAGASVLSPLTISWSAVSDPSGILGYNWQVSSSSTFSTVIAQNSTNGQTQDTVSGLANGTYFWRVQMVNGAFVQGAWSGAQSFIVTGAGAGAPGTPTLEPTQGYSTFHPREVITFNWSAVPGAASYVLQSATDPGFPVLTRIQFDNIPNPTFSFASGNEGFYSARVYAVDANGVAGVPSNVITYSVSYNNPLPPPPSPLTLASGGTVTLPVTLTWTNVLNPQPSGYELQIANDSGFKTIEEEAPQLNDPSRTVLSLTSGTKFWRVRSSQGDASPTTAAVTAWSKTGTFTVSAAPPAPVSLTLTSNPLYSGNSTWIAVQLTAAAPASGTTISLTSSDPVAAPVPAAITMPGNIAWMQFQMQAGQVTAPTPVTITATMSSGASSVQFNVLPPSLQSLLITPGTISGGAQPEAIIMLNGQAPAGGAAVNMMSDSSSVLAPASATIAAGSSSVSVPLPTMAVTTNSVATITASWNGASAQSKVTLISQQPPATLTLSPASTSGTTGSFATVTVASAPTAAETLQVTSSNPAVASVSNSVIIPAGSTTGGFSITTSAVTVQTAVTITVSGGGVSRSAILTVNPPPPPPQNATLTVLATGRSGERVTSSPAGINVAVGATATASVTSGTLVTLTVSNGRSAVWSGACSSGGNKATNCKFTATGSASVTANVQ
ncbi:MAG: hypothetical protein LAP21_13700 [Acidobacteriia bacterium]|nr:hypothetical protein [Terriglobia bacterium]